jgi:tetratricopeptide (TPR) repeat protein
MAYYQRADLYKEEGDFQKAIADLTEAIRLDPNNPAHPASRASAYWSEGERDKAVADLAEAIRLAPALAGPHAMRGMIYRDKGDLEKALAELDLAIELEPNSPCCYEIRAAMWLRQGDYDRGIADIQAALRLNAKDPAATFEDWPKSQLSPADLEHGRQQVGQMLADRPAMGQYGQRAAVLLEWAARKFAGEDLHQRIFWDAVDPGFGRTADHTPPLDGEPGAIRVRAKHSGGSDKGKERPFETMWLEAVFELYNITNVEEFERLLADAKAGKVPRNWFATRAAEIEDRAGEMTRSFYIHVFLPWARKHGHATDPLWLGARLRPNDPLGFVARNSSYWRYNESFLDALALGSMIEKGETARASELAAKLVQQPAADDEERACLFHFRGWAYAEAGETAKAIADYTETIRLRPGDPVAHSNRAAAYMKQRESALAIADYTEAIRQNPKLAVAYCGRGQAYARSAGYDKAIAEYTESIRLGLTRAEVFHCRGTAYRYKHDYDKAIADFTEAIRLAPSDACGYAGRAGAYLKMGRYDEAIADFTEAIRVAPDDPHAYYGRGWVYSKKGDKRKAGTDFAEGKRRRANRRRRPRLVMKNR